MEKNGTGQKYLSMPQWDERERERRANGPIVILIRLNVERGKKTDGRVDSGTR